MRQAPLAFAGLFALLSLYSLRHYYQVPKQPTRQSLQWLLAHKGPDDTVVAVYLAKHGFRFYGPSMGLEEGRSYVVAQSQGDLERIEAERAGRTIWLVTTFPRALRIEYPDLAGYIGVYYRKERTFPATVGDAEVSIWER